MDTWPQLLYQTEINCKGRPGLRSAVLHLRHHKCLMRVPLVQFNFQQELDPSTKYLPVRDYGKLSISGRHCLEMLVHIFSIFKQRGPEKHSCARAAETFCLKYLLCSVTLVILKIPKPVF